MQLSVYMTAINPLTNKPIYMLSTVSERMLPDSWVFLYSFAHTLCVKEEDAIIAFKKRKESLLTKDEKIKTLQAKLAKYENAETK